MLASRVFAALRPHMVVVLGDRYELLGVAALTAYRIPLVHIGGGDVREGAIDDLVRHALTKLSHLHIVPGEEQARRVRDGRGGVLGPRRWHPGRLDLEAARCPVCLGAALRTVGSRDGYCLARCASCRHSFVANAPPPGALTKLYERYSYEDRHLHAVPDFVFPILNRVVSSFSRYRGENRLLDVGFGAGALLRVAARHGWQTYGIETSPLAVRQARENALGDVIEGDFLVAPETEAFFDVVAMDGVLEHVPDPAAYVRRAHRHLRPGGLLYLTAPHGLGLSGRLLGVAWTVCAPPEHLHLFSVTSLRRCLSDAGFTDLRIRTRGLNPYELVAFVRRGVGRAARAQPFDRVTSSYRLNEALVGSAFGRLVKAAANAILGSTALGDNIVAYATKARS